MALKDPNNVKMEVVNISIFCLNQGRVKGAELFFKSLQFWLAGAVSWLAVTVLSQCRK